MPFIRLMGIVPLGIGLTVLFGLWFSNSPLSDAPVFMKLFASFVATPFVVMGIASLSGKLAPESQIQSMMKAMAQHRQKELQDLNSSEPGVATAGYQCDGCGASLAENADVSPHGDVKCEHCGRWFNIHKG